MMGNAAAENHWLDKELRESGRCFHLSPLTVD